MERIKSLFDAAGVPIISIKKKLRNKTKVAIFCNYRDVRRHGKGRGSSTRFFFQGASNKQPIPIQRWRQSLFGCSLFFCPAPARSEINGPSAQALACVTRDSRCLAPIVSATSGESPDRKCTRRISNKAKSRTAVSLSPFDVPSSLVNCVKLIVSSPWVVRLGCLHDLLERGGRRCVCVNTGNSNDELVLGPNYGRPRKRPNNNVHHLARVT